MAKVRTTRIRGKRVKLHLEPVDGYSIDYADGGEIYVDPRLPPEKAFAALVHELTHAVLPNLTEAEVIAIERDMCSAILRLFEIRKREGAW